MDKPRTTRVQCGHCGWRTNRLHIMLKDVDYDEYTPSYGYCPRDGAVLYPLEQLRRFRQADYEVTRVHEQLTP